MFGEKFPKIILTSRSWKIKPIETENKQTYFMFLSKAGNSSRSKIAKALQKLPEETELLAY